ncbi:MAG: hypothetical protein PHO76_02655 [Methylotenera sp.]|nr:hypothetical protein [Methylotenera sp.]MDD4927244.1 hypothetical protein [Methylotenera sp.]NOU39951.1 hypothetical protein [Methylotenera sp.]
MKILAADIGGTKTELAIFDLEQLSDASYLEPNFGMRFLNRDQNGFITIYINI